MADYVDDYALFLDEIHVYLDEIDAAGSNQHLRSDNAGHAKPETQHHEIQPNSLLGSARNSSTSSFSRETGVASSLEIPFTIQCDGNSLSDSVVGAQPNASEVSENNSARPFLAPVETTRAESCRTDAKQSNTSEHFPAPRNIGWSNRRPVKPKTHENTRFGTYKSNRKIEKKLTQYFPQKKLSHSVSVSIPETSTEREENAATQKTAEESREFKSASGQFVQVDNVPSIEMATDRVSRGSDGYGEVFLMAKPLDIEARSPRIGKKNPFMCDVCGKTFARKFFLERHGVTHTDDKPLLCHVCGKTFKYESSLKMHLKVHSGEGTHDCPECGRKCWKKSDLDEHLRIHTQEKPFICNTCGKRFTKKGNHKRHLLTHTGKKPYKCEVCGKAFSSKRSCTEHRNRQHGGKN